jgi:hypothetical protein
MHARHLAMPGHATGQTINDIHGFMDRMISLPSNLTQIKLAWLTPMQNDDG